MSTGSQERASKKQRIGDDDSSKDAKRVDSTILFSTCLSRPYNVLKSLIENGANVNLKQHDGSTPLHYTCLDEGDFGMAKLLVDSGAKIDAKDHDGKTPLYYPYKSNRFDIVKLLRKWCQPWYDVVFW